MSTIANHYPLSRRQLLARGLNANDPQAGRGLCKPCHDSGQAHGAVRPRDVERAADRELLPMADALGIGVGLWSPLGNGFLTGSLDCQIEDRDIRPPHCGTGPKPNAPTPTTSPSATPTNCATS